MLAPGSLWAQAGPNSRPEGDSQALRAGPPLTKTLGVTMKTATLLCLLLMHSSAFAYCPGGWLSGEAQAGRLSVAYDGNCSAGGPKLNIYWRVDKKGRGTVLFDQECKTVEDKDGVVQSFSCKSGGATPLAGATYKRIRTGIGDECDNGQTREIHAFTCTAGCGASAPKVLKEDPGCD